eukprot:CAMPEP_0174384082 /NCGR_PEP_ID=MMETSP0811_2-20130205/125674_1 /TAXON_ID=73025 ORGANISM="Eutreptiella gymnastica-like, Strain CCMP1594" /NCGR_SAMPLE_ID=MMETSP0811_2 /ASSEMBLY_ACC=CAM_ASM_000667 /LENGTH=182 /DNA_ID=CAMNT_0015537907 /DNA_START=585 /DNA_END=1132 /DNA_ORIENTATION=+
MKSGRRTKVGLSQSNLRQPPTTVKWSSVDHQLQALNIGVWWLTAGQFTVGFQSPTAERKKPSVKERPVQTPSGLSGVTPCTRGGRPLDWRGKKRGMASAMKAIVMIRGGLMGTPVQSEHMTCTVHAQAAPPTTTPSAQAMLGHENADGRDTPESLRERSSHSVSAGRVTAGGVTAGRAPPVE